MLVKVYTHFDLLQSSVDIDFDPEDGLETFFFQLLSLGSGDAGIDPDQMLLVDRLGREIIAVTDLNDIMGKDTSTAVEIWCYDKTVINCCSRNIPRTPADEKRYASDLLESIQPTYQIADMPFQVCTRCRHFFDEALISPFKPSVPGQLQCFECDNIKLIEIGIAPAYATSQLELEESKISPLVADGPLSPILLYWRRQLLQAALAQHSPFVASYRQSQEYQHFRHRLDATAQTVQVYESPQQQDVARQHIDYAKIFEYAQEYIAKNTLPTAPAEPPIAEVDYAAVVQGLEEKALLVGLMRWFKLDFFKWCSKPRCANPACDAPPGHMEGTGAVPPSQEEKSIGWASRTEVYTCKDCGQITRFPRFNNPAHLLLTRRGRCGEFANAFCLLCRALHLDAQYVLDFTDHVWCEVWLPSLQRFVHCDPCERALDTPLMYESGWNKKLTHTLSFSRYGVVDSLPRYSRKQSTALVRRSAEVLPEVLVQELIAAKDRELEGSFAMRRMGVPAGDLPWDTTQTQALGSVALTPLSIVGQGVAAVQALAGCDVNWAELQRRKRQQRREMAALCLNPDLSSTALCTQGRISGDLDWRLARGEVDQAPAASSGEGTVDSAGKAQTRPEWLRTVPVGCELVFDSCWAGGGCTGPVLLEASGNPAASVPCYAWNSPLLPLPPSNSCNSNSSRDRLAWLGGGSKLLRLGPCAPLSVPNTTNSIVRTRNGLRQDCPVPEYVAHSSMSNPTESAKSETFCQIPGYTSSVACDVMFPDGACSSLEGVVQQATERCQQESGLLGFTVLRAGEGGSAAVACVLLYSASGYPLVPGSPSCCTYARARPCQSPADAEPCVETGCLSNAQDTAARPGAPSTSAGAQESGSSQCWYYHLGGASHGDTAAFDTSSCLQGLVAAGALLRFCRIVVWAGESYVNGVQCCFEVIPHSGTAEGVSGERVTHKCLFNTPAFSSDGDCPSPHVLEIGSGDRVISVRCRSGALVDSLEITTAAGQVLRAGGGGGGDDCQVEIPEDRALGGFFGGTGGHLHNIGVVLREASPPCTHVAAAQLPPPPPAVAACIAVAGDEQSWLFWALLRLSQERGLQDCGLLGYCDQDVAIQQQCHCSQASSPAQLVALVCRLKTLNSPTQAAACLNTILTYLRNILKDPKECKYQAIRLANKVLRQSVLSAQGGLELLCFGPAAFQLQAPSADTAADLVLQSRASAVLTQNKSATFRAQYTSWLNRYIDFLVAAAALEL